MVGSLLFLLLTAVSSAARIRGSTPDSCFGENDLEKFIKCWSGWIAKHDSISERDWQTVLPTEQQRNDWKNLIGQMLSSDGTCQNLVVQKSISDFYQIKVLEDKSKEASFCILYETSTTGNRFLKGWGVFIVPHRQNWTQRNLHYSAAHPITDGPVEHQATAIFLRTRGRSLVITGATRNASAADSDCQPKNYRTDAAHNTKSMFHSALIGMQCICHCPGKMILVLATKNWQLQSSQAQRCRPDNCAFVQFHGKATTACPTDTIFISAGYSGRSPIYADPSASVNRLKSAWTRIAPSDWTAHTPKESKCDLTGTTNIFGRVLNGVHIGQECSTAADPSHNSGLFIHVEQAMIARETGAYDVWARSISAAFKPVRA